MALALSRMHLLWRYLLVSCFFAPAAVTPDEVKALYAQFVSLKGEDMGSSTGLNITAAEFQAALGFRDGGSVFLQRIFQLFDGNGDGVVNFEEFMHSIAVLTPTAAPEARLECACALSHPIAVAAAKDRCWPLPDCPSSRHACLLPPTAVTAVAFRLYDVERRGSISPANVKYMLSHSFAENGIAIADPAVDKIVSDTFRQYDTDRDG